jgi:hypothetical protein
MEIAQIVWLMANSCVPTREIEVIVYDASVGQVTTGYFDGKWHTYADDCDVMVTHWAFLPLPPGDGDS